MFGDINGCYDTLMKLLDVMKYDSTKDRLIFTGDIGDRGPKSFECYEFVQHHHRVKGNHEEMIIETVVNNNYSYGETWVANGGMWGVIEGFDKVAQLIQPFIDDPLVLVVGEGESRFHVVHAELINGGYLVTNDDVDKGNFNHALALWGRTLADSSSSYRGQYHSPDLSLTYCGHTVTPQPFQAERQIFIDTGSFLLKHPTFGITCADATNKILVTQQHDGHVSVVALEDIIAH